MTGSATSSRLAVISGASRGIGAATATALAANGWDVAINYQRDVGAADSVAETCRRLGRRAETFQADMGVASDVVRLFRDVDESMGTLDALIVNAGIVGTRTRVDELEAKRIERIFAVNVTGAFGCCREAVRRMSTRYGGRGGSIVIVGSAASRLGAPGEYVDYAASKGAVDTLTVGLAKEVATEAIRVNCVRPGIVDTDIHASGGQPDRAQRMSSVIPMQRPGQPDEVAAAIVWMCSPGASFTTGAFLDVSGGR